MKNNINTSIFFVFMTICLDPLSSAMNGKHYISIRVKKKQQVEEGTYQLTPEWLTSFLF